MIQSTRGFTLLELLVAVAIFALLGVGSYRLLASTIATRDQARVHDAALLQLQRAFGIMNRDLSQAIGRPVRNEYGDPVAALVLDNNTLDLTRIGLPNPLQQVRSDLQRVHYEVNSRGELVRSAWQQLDRERGAKPRQSVLLTQVESIQIKAYAPQGNLDTVWPPSSASGGANDRLAELPRGLEITVHVKPWGELRRFFRLPQNLELGKNASQ